MKMGILELLAVYTSPLKKVRFGPNRDGGYVLAGDVTYDRFVSCGIGDCVGFELDVLNRYPELVCYAIDGTIPNLPEKHERLLLSKLLVGPMSFQGTNLEWELAGAEKALLKMDIDGSEHTWIQHIPQGLLESVAQLVIEVHFLHHAHNWHILDKLRETHNLIHVHGNNYGGLTDQGVPNVAELTYLRKDFFDEALSYPCDIPMRLDRRNNPRKPELEFRL